jgi:hypothetical protein
MLQSLGATAFAATVTAYAAHAAFALGNTRQAEELAENSAAAAAHDDIWTQVLWRGAWAKGRARNGGISHAEEVAREAVTLAFRTDVLELQASALLDLAEVQCIAGRLMHAQANNTEALRLYEQKEHFGGVARARRALAAVDLLIGQPGPSLPD